MKGTKANIIDIRTDLKQLHHDDSFIIDEVEKVHSILEKHTKDKIVHTA